MPCPGSLTFLPAVCGCDDKSQEDKLVGALIEGGPFRVLSQVSVLGFVARSSVDESFGRDAAQGVPHPSRDLVLRLKVRESAMTLAKRGLEPLGIPVRRAVVDKAGPVDGPAHMLGCKGQ